MDTRVPRWPPCREGRSLCQKRIARAQLLYQLRSLWAPGARASNFAKARMTSSPQSNRQQLPGPTTPLDLQSEQFVRMRCQRQV